MTFVDPAFTVGGGVGFSVTRNVMVRPDVRMLFVRDEGETHTVGVFAVYVGYRFERRPVTPSR